MCVITIYDEGIMPDKEEFFNSVYNNPHGWGLLIRTGGNTLELRQEVTEDTDPQIVWDNLEDSINKIRYLHLRNATVGTVTQQNAQPFSFYKDETTGEELWFMHNGTLSSFKSDKDEHYGRYATYTTPLVDEPSDSLNFANIVLTPVFEALKNPMNIGSEVVLDLIINEFWSNYSNRGLIISTCDDNPHVLINEKDWCNIDVSPIDKDPYLASNDTYFKKIIRGPEHDRRLELSKQTLLLEGETYNHEEFTRIWIENYTDELVPSSYGTVWEQKSLEELTQKYIENQDKAVEFFYDKIRTIFITNDILVSEDLNNLASVASIEWEEIARKDPIIAGKLVSLIIFESLKNECENEISKSMIKKWELKSKKDSQQILDLLAQVAKLKSKHETATRLVSTYKGELQCLT